MKRRITIRDIAQKLGLHFTTVGRGLRNDSRLPNATIQKIQKAAAQMGYQPDPNARALAAYRQTSRPPAPHGTIALLTPQLATANDNFYLDGARRRAQELGYQIEGIAWREPQPLTGRRLTQILKARGTPGLLVFHTAAHASRLRRLQLDWSLFPAVGLGNLLLWPPLHHVSVNHYRNARLLVRKLISLGYRRIGFWGQAKLDRLGADHGGWRAGYQIEMERLAPIPAPLFYAKNRYDERAIRTWIREERLDAVISDHAYAARQLISLAGNRAPEELGVASLHIEEAGAISGIHQHLPQVGAMSVDLLAQLIHTGQRGIPEFPHRTLLEGTWFPGTTVRRVRQKT